MTTDEDRVREQLTERLGPRAVPDRVWDYLREEGHVGRVLAGERDILWLETRVSRFLVARADLLTERPAMVTRAGPGLTRDEARSTLLAREAGRSPAVQRFRADHLGGGTIAPDAVESWIRARETESAGRPRQYVEAVLPSDTVIERTSQGPYVTLPRTRVTAEIARTVTYAVPDSEWVRRVVAPPGSVLDRLRALAESLERGYHWPAGAGATFVLTGAPPLVNSLRVRRIATSAPAGSRIELDVEVMVSPRQLAREYAKIQRQVRGSGRRSRPMSEKHLRLAVFVATRPDDEPWPARRAAWNREYRKWRYRDERLFRRDAAQARARLLFRGTVQQRGGAEMQTAHASNGQTSRLLSLEALEERSDVSRHTWRLWLRQRKLPCIRLGRRVLVAETDYETFIASRRVEAASASPATPRSPNASASTTLSSTSSRTRERAPSASTLSAASSTDRRAAAGARAAMSCAACSE